MSVGKTRLQLMIMLYFETVNVRFSHCSLPLREQEKLACLRITPSCIVSHLTEPALSYLKGRGSYLRDISHT